MDIKEILYKAITNYEEHKIVSDIVQGNSPEAINAICSECMPILEKLEGEPSEKMVSFAEGLVHYLLTVALIPSQRKTSLSSIGVDVVIPDVPTLSSSPQDALVIAFPKTNDLQSIKKRVTELTKIQPHKENIWFVLENELPLEVKTYRVHNNDNASFSNIINDIIWFTSNKKQSKLKIFKI
jgi:hypothetical protein